jgi:hypothetical protein
MIVNVAAAAHVDSIIRITESGLLAQHLDRLSGHFRVIATTANNMAYDTLTAAGMQDVRLPFYAGDKYHQIRHAMESTRFDHTLKIVKKGRGVQNVHRKNFDAMHRLG